MYVTFCPLLWSHNVTSLFSETSWHGKLKHLKDWTCQTNVKRESFSFSENIILVKTGPQKQDLNCIRGQKGWQVSPAEMQKCISQTILAGGERFDVWNEASASLQTQDHFYVHGKRSSGYVIIVTDGKESMLLFVFSLETYVPCLKCWTVRCHQLDRSLVLNMQRYYLVEGG